MKSMLALSLATLLLAGTAHATVLDVKFGGPVILQAGTTNTVGSTVTGEFIFDTFTGTYSSFMIAGVSTMPGFASTASESLDRNTAIYRAQISGITVPTGTNSTFVLDLEALNTPFPATGGAAGLLTNTTQLTTNLDLASNPNSQFPSTFSYTLANGNGTNTRTVVANLASITAAAIPVPEPASSLLLISLVGLARRRRG